MTIHELERLGERGDIDENRPELQIRVVCSKGTYIRSLAHDIGAALGCGAYLVALRRTRSGPFYVDEAVNGDRLTVPEEREAIMELMLSPEDVGKLLQ